MMGQIRVKGFELFSNQYNQQSLKISYYALYCASEYAKEKEEKEKEEEKKMTIFRKYHGELLTTVSDCLFNNMLVY